VKIALSMTLLGLVMAYGCVPGGGSEFDDDGGGTESGSGSGGAGGIGFTGSGGSGAGNFVGDPKTCEEAAASASYVGCDFYPTVNPNNVWEVFDFAVVVANAGDNTVDVNVERGGTSVATAQIEPNSLETIYLPWVSDLKGPPAGSGGEAMPVTASVRNSTGAYHLTSTYPVTVYQFNALEYAPQGGPPGKNWSSCPALGIPCFSYSNDASLLLPSTAMTGNYRITAVQGWPAANLGPHVAITGTSDGTTVDVQLTPAGNILAGGGIPATSGGGTASFTIDRGEVVLLVGDATADFGGSLITASEPIQVISGIACRHMPDGAQACDHMEESVFPAETFGERYVVTRPTGPNGDTPGHVVKIFGNFDNTSLTYKGSAPPGAPTTINAGQVVDLGTVTTDFEVEGDQAFAVASFELGATIVDPGVIMEAKGDPAMSLMTAVEQYRDKYIFLAPTDYDVNYVDVVHPAGANITLDGAPLSGSQSPAGESFTVTRTPLSNTAGGAHVLESDVPVGIQVTGYGSYTSFYYPGGLNLKSIAPPPVQ
jgi:hypothetical protein